MLRRMWHETLVSHVLCASQLMYIAEHEHEPCTKLGNCSSSTYIGRCRWRDPKVATETRRGESLLSCHFPRNFCPPSRWSAVDRSFRNSMPWRGWTRRSWSASVKSTEAAHRKTLLHFPPNVTADDWLSLCAQRCWLDDDHHQCC